MNELDMILAGALAFLAVCGLRLYQSGASTQRLLARRSLELQAVVNALRRCEQRFDQRSEELQSELAMLTQDIHTIDRNLHAEPVRIEEAVRLAMDGVHAETLVSNGFSVAEAELAVSLYGHASKPVDSPARAAVDPARAAVDPARAAVNPARAAVNPARAAVNPARAAVNPARAAVNPARAAVNPARAAVNPARTAVNPARTAVKPARAAVKPARAAVNPAGEHPVGRAAAKHTAHRPKDWMGETQFRTLAEKLRAASRSQTAPFGTVSDRELEEDRILLSPASSPDHPPRSVSTAPRAARRIRRAVGSS